MSNTSAGSRGINLIRRFVHGEKLTSQEIDAMRATMYLLAQYASPALEWEEFRWKGVEHFIEKASYRCIMNFCICRDSMGCRDYPQDLGCIFLGEAARGIHPELVREVSRKEALEFARRCREAGLVHSVGRSKLDTVWLEIGPGDKLFTICNCCPCCCITRGLAYSHPLLGEKYSRMPGVKVTVTERCEGCGTCTEDVCIFHAIKMEGDQAVISDDCRGCGRCVSACPNDAIEVIIEDDQFVQHTIDRLSQKVDVT